MLTVLLQAILLSCAGGDKLAIAVGPVDAKGPDDADFKAVAVGTELAPKSWVRTGAKAKAVVDFGDGTELRINENSEILLEDSHHVEIKVGQVFMVSAKSLQNPFTFKTQFSPVEFTGGSMDLTFRPRDPSDPAVKTISRTVTSVRVLDGTASVGSRRYTQKVTAGYWCTLVDATLNTPDQIGDPTIPTRWVHELLLKRGKSTPEIDTRLQNMMQMLGRYQKGEEDLSDAGYRSLGEFSPPWLVANYLKYPPTAQETTRRRAAAKIVADLGTKAQAPALVSLLQDPDVEVRLPAAKGLERVAGTNLKFDEAYWKGDKLDAGQKAWDEWLKKNPAPKK